jgi:hypothetical protein
MLEELQRRNYTTDTIRGYILAVEQFAHYFRKSPELMGAEEIGQFQLHLLREKKLASRASATSASSPIAGAVPCCLCAARCWRSNLHRLR